MLVLTRKLQETIQVGENITITIVRIKGNTVRVGIEAPRDVRVARGEVFTKEPADKGTIEFTMDVDKLSTDETQPDSTGEETIDRPATPWQATQGGRRSPLSVPGRGSHTVPTHAV